MMEKHPVASSCPQCGSQDFTRVKVEGRVAFTDDRKCTACGTRYTPPTPAWAAFVFILLGILITAVGAAFCFFARGAVLVRDLVYGSILTVFGLSCIIYGIRSLRRPDASVPAEPQSGSKEESR
jgi:RNA polymerase subunit RPABC4/transcription elongation factor Spt4